MPRLASGPNNPTDIPDLPRPVRISTFMAAKGKLRTELGERAFQRREVYIARLVETALKQAGANLMPPRVRLNGQGFAFALMRGIEHLNRCLKAASKKEGDFILLTEEAADALAPFPPFLACEMIFAALNSSVEAEGSGQAQFHPDLGDLLKREKTFLEAWSSLKGAARSLLTYMDQLFDGEEEFVSALAQLPDLKRRVEEIDEAHRQIRNLVHQETGTRENGRAPSETVSDNGSTLIYFWRTLGANYSVLGELLKTQRGVQANEFQLRNLVSAAKQRYVRPAAEDL